MCEKHRYKLMAAKIWIYRFQCQNCGDVRRIDKHRFRSLVMGR